MTVFTSFPVPLPLSYPPRYWVVRVRKKKVQVTRTLTDTLTRAPPSVPGVVGLHWKRHRGWGSEGPCTLPTGHDGGFGGGRNTP